VCVSDEQSIDEIIVLNVGGFLAASAMPLRTIVFETLTLDVTGMRKRHHHVFAGNQVFQIDIGGLQDDFRTALIAKLRLDGIQFIDNDLRNALGTRQDVEQVGDDFHHFLVFSNDLVLFKAGQALQTQLKDRLGLHVGQQVTAPRQAEFGGQPFGTRGFRRGAQQHFLE
jgi:hypothetical protein